MRLDTPRIKPIPVGHFTPEQHQVLNRSGGEVLNIFRTLAHHIKLAKRWMVFANHILGKSTINPREREILILRIGWLCQSGYEFAQHEIIGEKAGLTKIEIQQIKKGPTAGTWGPLDRLLLQAVDELHQDQMISTDIWEGLSEHYSTEQLMDLVFTVGQYTMVSMALNTFGVQLEEAKPQP